MGNRNRSAANTPSTPEAKAPATTPNATPETPQEQTPAPAAKPAAKKARKFEVIHQVNLGYRDTEGGRQPDIRKSGETIVEGEIAAKDLSALIEAGIVRDSDAPIPPSQAEGHVAFDRLASIAQTIGAVTRDGATYQLGARQFQGIKEFRAGATLDELEAAIVAACGEER